MFVLGWAEKSLGYQWALTLGAGSWLLLYVIYAASVPRGVIVAAQALHGLAYVMFIIMGQVYAGKIAPEGLGGSMQGLIFAATTGVGLFLGTQLAGFAMDKCSAQRQVPVAEDLGLPAGHHAGRHVGLCHVLPGQSARETGGTTGGRGR